MKKHLLSQKLFRTYVGWFILYLLILLAISSIGVSIVFGRNIENTQRQLENSISENVQNYFAEMNAFSIRLLNSDVFKTVAVNQLPPICESGKVTSELFSKLYQEAYQMIQKDYRIGVVVNNQYYIWMGRAYLIDKIEGSSVHVYDNLVRNESPVVKFLEKNEYLEQIGYDYEESASYITLSRSMDPQTRYLNGKAILEIQVKQDEFVNHLAKIYGEESGLQINIFDSDGKAIYQKSDLDLSQYVDDAEEGDYKQKRHTIHVRKIFDDNLTMVFVKDTATYYNQLAVLWGVSVLLCICVIGIVLIMTYRISKQISKPIDMMCNYVHQMNLEAGIGYEEIETDIEELQFLSHSLSQMSEKLQESLQQIITLKDYELHAKMLALQAQMQPHFLFNTLMTIASMAEEEGNDGIYRICMNLNSMFRYIASEDHEGVHVFEEIKHVEHYVNIMKERFPNSVVTIDIPLELMDCRIPKLTIQPLIENAFKYCNRQNPEIFVRGVLEPDGHWRVEVIDNGSGFSKEKREEILKKCSESMENEKTLSNEIDGMGLVNVFARLNLFYGADNMLYDIGENEGRVVIGGIKIGNNRKE